MITDTVKDAAKGSAQDSMYSVGSPELLSKLVSLSHKQGLEELAAQLQGLSSFLENDLARIEKALAELDVPDALIGRAAEHLLSHGGKRLRPVCVSLAAHLGSGFGNAAADIAVAVELVHHATLLHDDVVDLADARRGAPTARTEYGNAASIFAGDWLLIEALRRVRRARIGNTLGDLLATIEEMILAESLQLEYRRRVDTPEEVYFRVAEGKTAALFRWAMLAGGQAGGLAGGDCEALGLYGLHLGVAFQLTDDLLDLVGDEARTGKTLLTDLRDGMMTFPLIYALDRRPELREPLARSLAQTVYDEAAEKTFRDVVKAVQETGAIDRSRELARNRSLQAVRSLANLPEGVSRQALIAVAESTVQRSH